MRYDYGTELDLSAFGTRDVLAPSATAAPPAPRPTPGARQVSSPHNSETVHSPDTPAPLARELVIPVKLPAGARYEIVIRLQLDTTA